MRYNRTGERASAGLGVLFRVYLQPEIGVKRHVLGLRIRRLIPGFSVKDTGENGQGIDCSEI